jgi:hypothetical protein
MTKLREQWGNPTDPNKPKKKNEKQRNPHQSKKEQEQGKKETADCY